MISAKDDILIEVQEAVCLDYYKLEVFAVVLLKFTATAEFGKAIMKEYSKYLITQKQNSVISFIGNFYYEGDLIKVDNNTSKITKLCCISFYFCI